MEDLGKAKQGDVVLLHACAHNPTGVLQWPEFSKLVDSIIGDIFDLINSL